MIHHINSIQTLYKRWPNDGLPKNLILDNLLQAMSQDLVEEQLASSLVATLVPVAFHKIKLLMPARLTMLTIQKESLTHGKDRKVLCSLKATSTPKIDKPKKLMISAKNDFGKETKSRERRPSKS